MTVFCMILLTLCKIWIFSKPLWVFTIFFLQINILFASHKWVFIYEKCVFKIYFYWKSPPFNTFHILLGESNASFPVMAEFYYFSIYLLIICLLIYIYIYIYMLQVSTSELAQEVTYPSCTQEVASVNLDWIIKCSEAFLLFLSFRPHKIMNNLNSVTPVSSHVPIRSGVGIIKVTVAV